MNELDRFAKRKSKFFKLRDGEEVIFTLKDYYETQNMQGDMVIAYKIDLEDLGEKIWQSGSIRLASAIAALPDNGRGHRIKVSRKGSKFDTTYEVELAEVDLGYTQEAI